LAKPELNYYGNHYYNIKYGLISLIYIEMIFVNLILKFVHIPDNRNQSLHFSFSAVLFFVFAGNIF